MPFLTCEHSKKFLSWSFPTIFNLTPNCSGQILQKVEQQIMGISGHNVTPDHCIEKSWHRKAIRQWINSHYRLVISKCQSIRENMGQWWSELRRKCNQFIRFGAAAITFNYFYYWSKTKTEKKSTPSFSERLEQQRWKWVKSYMETLLSFFMTR